MSAPVYDRHGVRVFHGDCLDAMRELDSASIDAVVTDPPYGLEFMGKDWDSFRPGGKQPQIGIADGTPYRRSTGTPSWSGSGNPRCLNCGGTKYDRTRPTGCACVTPLFPNEAAAHMRAFQEWCTLWAAECLRVLKPGGHLASFGGTRTYHRMACAVEDAGFEIRDAIGSACLAWVHGQGFPKGKSQLKPAWEPIVLARKASPGLWLNVDACRVGDGSDGITFDRHAGGRSRESYHTGTVANAKPSGQGRWPTNVLLSHAEQCGETCAGGCPVAELDAQSGNRPGAVSNGSKTSDGMCGSDTFKIHEREQRPGYADQGGASRFFPVFRWGAKAATAERPQVGGVSHPTVKPLDLMRWLVRLVTPPGGLVLDPFAGSGTTLQAARAEGLRAVGIEREDAYLPLIKARLDARPKTTAAQAAVADDGPLDLFDLLDGEAS